MTLYARADFARIGSVEPNGVRVRPAVASDAAAAMELLHASFAGYSAFAAPGWAPPEPEPNEVEMMAEAFGVPEVWYVLAEDGDGLAGQCGFVQAHTERWRTGDPIEGLAHFWQLFVRPDWWGRGLGAHLHDLALAEIPARGFTRARLWTPEGQSRARRFYERRGWRLGDERMDASNPLGLPIVQYVHDLSGVTVR
jgi:GNAT superfamily N-acetyltransferase